MESKQTTIQRPITRREFIISAAKVGAAALFFKLPLTSCSENPTGLQYEGYGKVEEKTLQKGKDSVIGTLSIRLKAVVVENEYKKTKRADVELLKEDGSVDYPWGFNLGDIKKDVKASGGGSQNYALECTGMPSFESTDEWVTLRLWKKK